MMSEKAITGRGPSRRLPVGKGRVVSLAFPARASSVVCISGRVWLTEESDRHDYILAPGMVHEIEAAGLVVIEGLVDSIVQVNP